MITGAVRYFHGSSKALPVGTVLRGRGSAYETDWLHTDFYSALEQHRPDFCVPQRDAVFMVGDVDDVDCAGGATDWCFEMKPIGSVSRHDLNWSSRISCLISEGATIDDPLVRQAALNYWSGIPSPDEVVWEYLAREAEILRCGPYETFDL